LADAFALACAERPPAALTLAQRATKATVANRNLFMSILRDQFMMLILCDKDMNIIKNSREKTSEFLD
jgi:hypothetical protein